MSTVAAPLGTENGTPLATILSRPDFSFVIFTGDGPLGADAFLYLKSVVEPFVLQEVFGRLHGTAPLPLLNVTEESEPPTGSDPVMLMLGSVESNTTLPLFINSFLAVTPWSVARAMPTPNTAMLAAAATTVMTTLRSLGLSILCSLGPAANPPRMDG